MWTVSLGKQVWQVGGEWARQAFLIQKQKCEEPTSTGSFIEIISMPQKKVSKGYPPLKGHWWNITCGKSQFRSLIGARSPRGTCPWPMSSITQNIWGETVLKEEE